MRVCQFANCHQAIDVVNELLAEFIEKNYQIKLEQFNILVADQPLEMRSMHIARWDAETHRGVVDQLEWERIMCPTKSIKDKAFEFMVCIDIKCGNLYIKNKYLILERGKYYYS